MFRHMFSLLLEGRNPSLDLLLAGADAHGKRVPPAVSPDPDSPPRTPFESTTPGIRHSLTQLRWRQRGRAVRRMAPLMRDIRAGVGMYDRPRPSADDRMTPDQIAAMEDMARGMGASDIGYVRVPPTAVFAGHEIPCAHAIVFTVEMDPEPIATAPSFESQLEVMDAYARLAKIARHVAERLRADGIEAFPGTSLGGTTDYVQLGELAGLGVIGYHGLLITPHDGARLRIGVVYVNVSNLPLDRPNPHAWVRDFCAMCTKCVRACPVGAIYPAPRERPGDRHQTIDHGACRDYFTEHFGCGVCQAVCPFSVAGYEAIRTRFKGNPNAPRFTLPLAIAPS
ncbi:MAG: 4Fe-4S dicluster domain-containing protein [Trueperaceae bacterium]|nr:MAG: 4Fe-4S dicluster domain-containing protein [Trueperaceae bacterium]